MLAFNMGDKIFQYRAAAIIIQDGYVLLQEFPRHGGYWALPGGRVDPMETSENSVRREMMEELNSDCSIIRQVYFMENFFNHKGIKYHEIGSYFEVELLDEKLKDKNRDHYGVEGDEDLRFRWFKLTELSEITLYPEFLREGLLKLPETLTKIVENRAD